jgi:hypothetical protein
MAYCLGACFKVALRGSRWHQKEGAVSKPLDLDGRFVPQFRELPSGVAVRLKPFSACKLTRSVRDEDKSSPLKGYCWHPTSASALASLHNACACGKAGFAHV